MITLERDTTIPPATITARTWTTPVRLSIAIAVLATAASALGLFLDGFYADGAWAREALRAGDLVTLAVAVPLLAGSLLAARRGSLRAEALWVGTLLYTAYNFGYYVFGAAFNDAFVLHITLLSLAVVGLLTLLPSTHPHAMQAALDRGRTARRVGLFLAIVGVAQGGLWLFVLLRKVITGALINDIPADGQHLVFALDLGFLVPALVLGGVALWRRRPFGAIFGSGMAVMGAVYQLNLMLAGVFQDAANVEGVRAFPLESIVLTVGFLAAASLLLRALPRPGPPGREGQPTGRK